MEHLSAAARKMEMGAQSEVVERQARETAPMRG